jgi:hypothetical protein
VGKEGPRSKGKGPERFRFFEKIGVSSILIARCAFRKRLI